MWPQRVTTRNDALRYSSHQRAGGGALSNYKHEHARVKGDVTNGSVEIPATASPASRPLTGLATALSASLGESWLLVCRYERVGCARAAIRRHA